MLTFATGKLENQYGEAVNMKYTIQDENYNIVWETNTMRKDNGNESVYSYSIGLKKECIILI